MRRTPEWLEEYTRKQRNRQTAREWNGNVEPVKITSGDARAVRDAERGLPRPVRSGPLTPLYPLVTLCRSMKIAEPVPEHKFHPTRKFRFDYAWPLHMLACEIEGGLWTQGRHSRGKGAIADLEKYSEAAILGWRLIYATPQELDNGVCIDRVMRALTDREAA